MVAQKKRAQRRAALEAMKVRVVNYHGGYAKGDPRRIGKLAHTPKPCSCSGCGNRRRWMGDTVQERRDEQ